MQADSRRRIDYSSEIEMGVHFDQFIEVLEKYGALRLGHVYFADDA